MGNKKIIGLVGQIACGKGAIARIAKDEYHASTYRFSSMLRDILSRIYLEVSRQNLSALSKAIRQTFGEDTMAKVMAEDVKRDPNPLIVVDGIRRLKDIEYLRQIPGFKLVRVVAEPKLRYDRLVDRNENEGDREKTYEEFLEDQVREADAQIPEVMEQADLEIDNNGNWDELVAQAKKILEA